MSLSPAKYSCNAPVRRVATARCRYWFLKAHCLSLRSSKNTQVPQTAQSENRSRAKLPHSPINISKHRNAASNCEEDKNEAHDHGSSTTWWCSTLSVKLDKHAPEATQSGALVQRTRAAVLTANVVRSVISTTSVTHKRDTALLLARSSFACRYTRSVKFERNM